MVQIRDRSFVPMAAATPETLRKRRHCVVRLVCIEIIQYGEKRSVSTAANPTQEFAVDLFGALPITLPLVDLHARLQLLEKLTGRRAQQHLPPRSRIRIETKEPAVQSCFRSRV